MQVDELQARLPIEVRPYQLEGRNVGLVIVHEVNGFCTAGAGNLAPQEPNAQISTWSPRPTGLARRFVEREAARSSPFSTPTSPASPSRPTRRIACAAAARRIWCRSSLGWRTAARRHPAAQRLYQRLRRRHRAELRRRRARPVPQQGRRLDQRPPAAKPRRGRYLHRHLRPGLRRDHAVGAQPRPDADAHRTSWCTSPLRDLRSAARGRRGAWACLRPRPTRKADDPSHRACTSWPGAAQCWPTP